MKPPAISIVIPAYNRQQYIAAAIKSVLDQTRGDFELIVWDDGSFDGTVAAAKEAAGDDPRIRVIAAEHGGAVASLRGAIALSSGKYLGSLDSDDLLAPTALAETAAVLDARPDIGMVYSDYCSMSEAGQVRGVGNRCQIPYSKDRLLVDFMTFQFRLIRRSVYDAVGGLDPAMERAEDYDLCLKLSEVTQIHHLKRPLYYYRVHQTSVSSQDRAGQIAAAKNAVEHALVRRGMSDEYELDVQIISQFRLKKKKKD